MKYTLKQGNDILLILFGEEIPSDCTYTILQVQVDDWNAQLSPWPCPPLFSKQEPFSGNADQTLQELLNLDIVKKPWRKMIIGGYSLGGLFALYACTKIELFDACLSVSGSLWYPQWTAYLKEHPVHCEHVYLSLGDAEAKTRNKIMSQVDDNTQETYALLKEYTNAYFTYNPGNHFHQPEIRIQNAIVYIEEKYPENKE